MIKITHMKYLLRVRLYSKYFICVMNKIAPLLLLLLLLSAHSWDLSPHLLTFCLVLRGCDFNFSSLLLEILRNCLRSP